MNSFKLSLSLLCLTLSLMHAQTNPAPRTLPYSESFNSMLAPTYPTGWGGWSQGTLSGAFQTAAPTGDRVLAGSGTAASITNNVYDFSQKLGFLNSGSTNHGLATALVTTGFASINVGYSIMTIRDNNERTLVVGLQYRVGTSGPFTNISGTSYHNNLTVQVAGNSGVNVQTRSITLPAVCNNQSVVQLRFIAKDSIGAGARPSFAIDNFSASGTSCSGFSISASAQSATTFCQGGSVVLKATGAISYLWNNNQSGDSIVATQSGSYTVVGTDPFGCTASAGPIVVAVNPSPTLTLSPNGPTVFCQGGSVSLVASGANTYSWNTGQNMDSIAVSTAGTYQVVGTDQNGCLDSTSVQVGVNPLPSISISSNGPLTFCQGAQVTLLAFGAQTYLWSSNVLGDSIVVQQSGGYYVVGTDQNGCFDTSQTLQVIVNPLPVVTITPNGPTSICQGASVPFTAQGGSTYVWPCGCPGQTQNINLAGPVTVWGTDQNGCSDSSNTVMVSINPNPTAQILPGGPTVFCQGGSVSLNGAIGLINSWSNGQTADSITVNQSGLYSLTVTDGNGCTDSTFIQVTANPLPTISVAALGNTTLCQGDSVEIAATGGILYQWNNGFSSANIWASTSGNYSVFGTDQNGCSDSSNAIAISVLNPPVVLQQPSNVQESVGNTATFSVSAQDPNDAFQWQGNTGSGFQNLSNGGQYAGTTTNQLSISNLTLANSGYTFRCQISNVACSANSQQASLTVVPNSSFANQGSSDLRVFPNPAQDFIAVWQSGKGSSVPYTLSNVQGQILGQGMLNSSSTPLNIGFLPPGSYQISVGGSSIRFIKE